jgi:hypothetical protein
MLLWLLTSIILKIEAPHPAADVGRLLFVPGRAFTLARPLVPASPRGGPVAVQGRSDVVVLYLDPPSLTPRQLQRRHSRCDSDPSCTLRHRVARRR